MDKNMEYAIEIVTQFCRNNMNLKRKLPIRASEVGILIFIKRSENAVTPVSISEFFNISKPAVTASITSLYKKGYIEKIPMQSDKRSFQVILTEKAINLTNDFYDEYVKIITLLEKGLTKDEFTLLIKLLKKSNSILEGGK
ncbi:MarR family winged helix-turn-helix transcriptional regulator [Clostridium cylindrosporum]|uniref:Transcriptional regulator, MarR family n=1 Tax=Clostridium cylindrosporum DSM 605 TaxID=1121307 RepID=A0A0J8G450_CLOCY|nr:MarR family transcriptional regulator [Clostridium cylindrosporum]KMT22471.1 transcriptional regulator, MarR family [Clostridium cylindrosporum DSM 605]